ncbi:Gluconolactonase [Bacteroidales bacterium Barb6XT]|nr:Gluconolactonase [Bacteroidales bacterium Barb6XT]
MNQKMKRITAVCLLCVAAVPQTTAQTQTFQAELLYQAEAVTGEGSIWHPERKSLFWVDIEGQTLYEYLPQAKECRLWKFDRMVTTVVPETKETVVIALQNEIIRLNVEDGSRSSVALIDDVGGKLRCNDGKCDPDGRLWIGTMTMSAPRGSAGLYTVDTDGNVTARLDGITTSNGLVWSDDKKYMYYNDTPTGEVARYRYDSETGNITYDGVAVTLAQGNGAPDGMTKDADGNLWVAQWGGYGVYCYNPHSGELLAKVEVPAPNVASCAFGGENLDILYITTARAWLSPEKLAEYPLSGSLFQCKPGMKGVPADTFK